MPLVRVDLPEGRSAHERAAIADVVYQAMVTTANVPANDRFVVLSEHSASDLIMDPHYLLERSPAALVIQITLNQGRSLEVKKALYRAIADGLHERVGIAENDVMISLVEVPKENWSFGGGIAQYAD
ncbi:MAG TPA: tautomerase family protein [Microlunatus sp.]